MSAAISINGLRKSFGSLEVLKGIDFEIERGEVVCMIGASGSGKSTLLRCINYLEIPQGGEVVIMGRTMGTRVARDGSKRPALGRDLAEQRSRIGMVFQLFNLWPNMTALGNVIEALLVVKAMKRDQATDIGLEALGKVGLLDKRDDYPATLSGGQQQRVAIARALAMSPEILLFDEPTSSLDPELVGEVIEVMKKLAGEGNTMVVATHELAFARDTAHRMVFLDDGIIAEEAPAGEFFANPKSERLKAFLGRMRND